MAIGVAWLSALAFPIAVKLGLTESGASKLPNFGFFAGAALGLAMCVAQSVKQALYYLWLLFITGFVFWFFALVLEGLLVNVVNIQERYLAWLPWAGFGLGFLVAGVGVFAEVTSGRAQTKREPLRQA